MVLRSKRPVDGRGPASARHAGRSPARGAAVPVDGERIQWFTTGANVAAYTTVMARTEPEAAPHAAFSMIVVPTDTVPRQNPIRRSLSACHRGCALASSRNASLFPADPLGRSRPGTVSTRTRPRQSRPPIAARPPRPRQEPATPRHGRPPLLGSAAPLRTDPSSWPASARPAPQAAPTSARTPLPPRRGRRRSRRRAPQRRHTGHQSGCTRSRTTPAR